MLWGVADFTGGLAAKRAPAPLVAGFSGIGALAVLFVAMPFMPGMPALSDLAWGAAAGVCGAAGASLMYKSLALGPMSLASPVFSLIGLCVPVVFGLIAGERPQALAWFGVGLVILAIPLLSLTGRGPGHFPRDLSRPHRVEVHQDVVHDDRQAHAALRELLDQSEPDTEVQLLGRPTAQGVHTMAASVITENRELRALAVHDARVAPPGYGAKRP